GTWPVTHLVFEAKEYGAEARAYRDAAYQRALGAAWAVALSYRPMELAEVRALLDRQTLIAALERHRGRDPRIQGWIERLQHRRNDIEDRGARGLDRALSVFVAATCAPG